MKRFPPAHALLIEPVWNRNSWLFTQSATGIVLLIEPVWNRNLMVCSAAGGVLGLLIEPVWNRNDTNAINAIKKKVF